MRQIRSDLWETRQDRGGGDRETESETVTETETGTETARYLTHLIGFVKLLSQPRKRHL